MEGRWVNTLSRVKSDHNLIVIHFHKSQESARKRKKKKKRYRFEDMEGYKEMIKQFGYKD